MSDCSDAAGNGFQYVVDKSDCFAVDLGSFPSGIDREFPSNSRIVLQKSLSRKGIQRGREKNPSFCTSAVDEDRGGVIMGTIEKAASVTGGCTEPQHPASPSQLVQHQIRITTPTAISGTSSPPSTAEGNRVLKRSGSRRSPPRGLDPRRVLLFFATLSVMGTTLILLFTLSMDNKQGADDDTLGW